MFCLALLIVIVSGMSFVGVCCADEEASVSRMLYVIQPGDFLSRIAVRLNTTTSSILDLNPGLDPNRLQIGHAIFVPSVTDEKKVWPLEQELVCGPKGMKKIALTFDAGGCGEKALLLLDNLAKEGIECSFFLTGKWAENYPDAVRIIAASGHKVHNHSYSHPDFTKLEDHEIIEEVTKAERILSNLSGQSVKPWFRFPFGARDKRTRTILAQLGYRTAYWTLDSLDSVGETKTAQFIAERVKTAGGKFAPQKSLDGCIVLLHVGAPNTAAAVPDIVGFLQENGFQIVSLDKLLEYQVPMKE